MLAEIPDLWDVNISEWDNDSATSRFEKEGYQESYISFVKSVTTKPVVGVGRYTSPDTMASLIKNDIPGMFSNINFNWAALEFCSSNQLFKNFVQLRLFS